MGACDGHGVAATLHTTSIILLIGSFVWNLLQPHVRAFWWMLTQISSWSEQIPPSVTTLLLTISAGLLTHIVYFGLCLLVDATTARNASRRLNLHRDRLFAVCGPLALMVCLFFACVVVPFTPR